MKSSEELLSQWDHDKTGAPKPYIQRRSIKQLLASSAAAVVAVGLGLVTILLIWQDIRWPIWCILALMLFWVYREAWQWANNYITCDPHDGNLCIQEKANIWLLVLGSPDDTESIENVNLDTPTRTPLAYLFKRVTLYVGTKRLPNIMDVDHLLKIKQYRTSLEQQQKTLSLLSFETSVAILAALERIEGRLATGLAPVQPISPPLPLPPVSQSDLDTHSPTGEIEVPELPDNDETS